MQRLEVSGAVRLIYGSLGVKWLKTGSTFNILTNITLPIRKTVRFSKMSTQACTLYSETTVQNSSEILCITRTAEHNYISLSTVGIQLQ